MLPGWVCWEGVGGSRGSPLGVDDLYLGRDVVDIVGNDVGVDVDSVVVAAPLHWA